MKRKTRPSYISGTVLTDFITRALKEDIGEGDHTSLACIPPSAKGKAKLLVKEKGIVAGVELARHIFKKTDPSLSFQLSIPDGNPVKPGDEVFTVSGKDRSLLAAERLMLNCMQRMSGIATLTAELAKLCAGTNAKLLDTRKTTPGMRMLEKWAVLIGGGTNHRMGLYDMILIKDNHVDYCGGIRQAILAANAYLKKKKKRLKIEIEVRNMAELAQVLEIGRVQRILLDNFSPAAMKEAIARIGSRFETEASGGITAGNIREYALTGVDFISVGALTHSYKSLDLSFKAC